MGKSKLGAKSSIFTAFMFPLIRESELSSRLIRTTPLHRSYFSSREAELALLN